MITNTSDAREGVQDYYFRRTQMGATNTSEASVGLLTAYQ